MTKVAMGRAQESRGVTSWNWEERDNERILAIIKNSEDISRTSLSSQPTPPVKD